MSPVKASRVNAREAAYTDAMVLSFLVGFMISWGFPKQIGKKKVATPRLLRLHLIRLLSVVRHG